MGDFNFEIYLYNYDDIKNEFFNNKKDAYQHWIKIGRNNGKTCNLILKPEDKNEYENMDWELYLFYNDLNKNYVTHDSAFAHWILYGKNENKIFYKISDRNFTNIDNKKNVFIITNMTNCGTGKYIDDIINEYGDSANFYFINSKKDFLKYKFTQNDILFLQHLLYCNLTVNDILTLKNIFKCKLIISIHDFYWLNDVILKKFDKDFSCHNSYLKSKININNDIIKLFSLADEIVHPSKFTYNIFLKYFPSDNFKLVSHNDYQIDYTTKNIPSINNNTINIGVFHRLTECKGKYFINYLQKKIIKFNGYNINWKIVGKNIPFYKEEEFFTFIAKYNINCLTLLNKWGETWCYSLTKFINSGLPIIYNNFGAFKERIPNSEHYFKVYEDEKKNYNLDLLEDEFKRMLEYIIVNNSKYTNINTNTTINYNQYYNKLFRNI